MASVSVLNNCSNCATVIYGHILESHCKSRGCNTNTVCCSCFQKKAQRQQWMGSVLHLTAWWVTHTSKFPLFPSRCVRWRASSSPSRLTGAAAGSPSDRQHLQRDSMTSIWLTTAGRMRTCRRVSAGCSRLTGAGVRSSSCCWDYWWCLWLVRSANHWNILFFLFLSSLVPTHRTPVFSLYHQASWLVRQVTANLRTSPRTAKAEALTKRTRRTECLNLDRLLTPSCSGTTSAESSSRNSPARPSMRRYRT